MGGVSTQQSMLSSSKSFQPLLLLLVFLFSAIFAYWTIAAFPSNQMSVVSSSTSSSSSSSPIVSSESPASVLTFREESLPSIQEGKVTRIVPLVEEKRISYETFINLLSSDDSTGTKFRQLLRKSLINGPPALFWECPPVTGSTLATTLFEYVIVESKTLNSRKVDPEVFEGHFQTCKQGESVVSFKNIGGDAVLVVPCPPHSSSSSSLSSSSSSLSKSSSSGASSSSTSSSTHTTPSLHSYTHLALFARHAPEDQFHSLFRLLSTKLTESLTQGGSGGGGGGSGTEGGGGAEKYWLSTSGLGVSWLHVRIDTVPKYYSYIPYKNM